MRIIFFVLIMSLRVFPIEGLMYHESPIEPWGADWELSRKRHATSAVVHPPTPVQNFCVSCIHFFQDHISPIDGPRSSFYPTSSQYTLEAIQKYGACKGIALGCDRLLRENREAWVYPTGHFYGIERKLDPVR